MKKIILTMFFISIAYIVVAQTITINSIGMHKDGDPGNFSVEPGDVVKVNVNYTTSGIGSMKDINSGGNSEEIYFLAHTEIPPSSSGNFATTSVSIFNQSLWDPGTNQSVTFYFTVPSTPGRNSFQIAFNISGFYGFGSSINSSIYTSQASLYGALVPDSEVSYPYQSYMLITYDQETEIPTLYRPNSPTVATYDNNSLLIDFQLAEVPNGGSVKLYFSPNSDGSSPSTTLTLASAYENTSRHQITLDATNFSTASSHIEVVTGSTSLTHLNTYYVAIGYKDELGNPEETSPWNKLIYDNIAIKPTLVSGSSASGSSFNLNFTLGEDSAPGGITVYVKDNDTYAVISTIDIIGSFSSGSNSINLDGADLLSSAGVSDVSGLNILDSSEFYRFSLEMVDIAGNTNTSVTSGSFQYLNQNITIDAVADEINSGVALLGYNLGNYQPIGYVGLKTASGTANLSNLGIVVSGTIDPDDAAYIALYESSTTSFSSATSISNPIVFTGTGTYNFSINNRSITDQYKYYFVAVSLNSTGLTYSDRIEISTNDALITTSGTVSSFNPGVFADKCLYRALILNYFDNFPSIAPGSPDAPFFRLDIKTNQGTAALTSLKLKLTGTLTSNDVVSTGFKVWESSSTTFDPSKAKAIQLGGSANYNDVLTFSGFNTTASTDEKYYFFTVTTKETANSEATIGGDVLEESYIGTTSTTTVETESSLSGFPLTGEEQTLPVELSSFNAVLVSDNQVKIQWTVETETSLTGYYILKNTMNDVDSADQIPVLIPSINSSQTYTYSFVDGEVQNNTVYYYWLKTVELSNESEMFGPTIVSIGDPDANDTPEVFYGTKLFENYPNPFNPSTNISFAVTNPSNVKINIYNVKGQLVKTMFNDFVATPNKKINLLWNGKDNRNQEVASGVYYTKMEAGKYTEFKKMLLLK